MAQYMSDRRPDITFTTKEILRKCATPTMENGETLTKLGRYASRVPKCVQLFPWIEKPPDTLDVFVDSDWCGGGTDTRRSTSGGATCMGVELKQWRSTQATISLSSAEAENKAAVKGLASGFNTTLLKPVLSTDT